MKDDVSIMAAVVATAIAVAPAAALARDPAPVAARPVVAAPERIAPKPTGPTKTEIIRQLNARAKAAVAGGADPAQVRAAVQAHKQKLRRRANAG